MTLDREIETFLAAGNTVTRCPTRYAVPSEHASIDRPVIVPIATGSTKAPYHGGKHWRATRHLLFRPSAKKHR